MEAASLNSNDSESPIIVAKEHVNNKDNPDSLNLRAANKNFDKPISRPLKNRQVETKKS